MTEEKDTQQPGAGESAQTAEEKPLRASVERTGTCECVIKIEAAGDLLKERYEEALRSLQKEVVVPGFRQGKAPLNLVAHRFAKRVKTETLTSALTEAYDEAVKSNQLTVVAELESPDVENIEWEVGQPLELQVKCEILPEVELQPEQYKGLSVDIPKLALTEEMLQEELTRFAKQLASWEQRQEPGIDWEDFVEAQVTAAGQDEGAPTWSGKLSFYPRDERIGAFVVKGIKGAVVSAKAGDVLELDAELPAENLKDGEDALKALAGQGLKLSAKLSAVYRQKVPELNDELAKKLGLKDAAEIPSVARTRLERRVALQKKQATEYSLIDAILDKAKFEMPASLVKKATRDEVRKLMLRAMRMGSTRQEAEKLAEGTLSQSQQVAVRKLKAAYVLKKIADKERIFVLDSELEEQIRALAAQQGATERHVRRYLEENDLVPDLREEMREERAIKFLLDNAQVNEIDPAEFDKRMREKLQEPAGPEAKP